jgi:Fe2+ or Zn2+ uptake regulation protein
MNNRISVFCLWRDSEKTIYRTLKQLEDLESIDGFEFSYFFYENDSTDKTVDILKEWISKKSGDLKAEILNAPKFGSTTDPARMKFLCECRNKCKDLALDNQFDYSLLIDSDIEFDNENFILQFEDLNKLDNAAMVTANVRQNIPDLTFNQSIDSYYDVYAFRDKYGSNGIYFSDCPSYICEDQLKWKLSLPIITMSSFGGFALIKSNIFNKVRWSSDIHCDHVNMCYDISRHGLIYLNPRSKVFVNVDVEKINLENCIKIAKDQKQNHDYLWNNSI